MAGVPGRSGGHNRKSIEAHLLSGTFRKDRHGAPPVEAPPLSPADGVGRCRGCRLARGAWPVGYSTSLTAGIRRRW